MGNIFESKRSNGSSLLYLRHTLLLAARDACLQGCIHHAPIIWPLIQRGVADGWARSCLHGAKGKAPDLRGAEHVTGKQLHGCAFMLTGSFREAINPHRR